jgi:hypothetical protein
MGFFLMKNIMLGIFIIFFAFPAYALDVSVVDGRAQVAGTVEAMQARASLLKDVVSVTTTQLAETIIELDATQTSLTITQNDLDVAEVKLVRIDNCAKKGRYMMTLFLIL